MSLLLLPFSQGLDLKAINQAIILAQWFNATLVPLSLVPAKTSDIEDIRLEHLERSNDFLELVRHRAAKSHHPIEQAELYTSDPAASILTFAQEIDCNGILLFERQGNGVLLRTHEILQILDEAHKPLYLVHLIEQKHSFSLARLLESRLRQSQKQQYLSDKLSMKPNIILHNTTPLPDVLLSEIQKG